MISVYKCNKKDKKQESGIGSKNRKRCCNFSCIFIFLGILLLVGATILVILERAKVIFITFSLDPPNSLLDECPTYTRRQDNGVCQPDPCTPD